MIFLKSRYLCMRKQIQDKLIKFATRIPVFMYLTDYRECSLRDVITQLEPGLFKKVIGLSVSDFELLCSIGVFNASLMNEAVFNFKRYEDASLSYTGIDRHGSDTSVGGWDTSIRREEYERLFCNQQATLNRLGVVDAQADVPEVTEIVEPQMPVSTVAEARKPIVAPVTKPVPAQNAEPEFDLTGICVGAEVMHKVFGKGVISEMDTVKKRIRVTFSAGEKMFVFPAAFAGGFLSLI